MRRLSKKCKKFLSQIAFLWLLLRASTHKPLSTDASFVAYCWSAKKSFLGGRLAPLTELQAAAAEPLPPSPSLLLLLFQPGLRGVSSGAMMSPFCRNKWQETRVHTLTCYWTQGDISGICTVPSHFCRTINHWILPLITPLHCRTWTFSLWFE